MRTRNHTRSINFTEEDLNLIKKKRDELQKELGLSVSLRELVMKAINSL